MANADIIIRNIKLHILSGIDINEPLKSIYTDITNCFSKLNKYENANAIAYGKDKNDLYIFHKFNSRYTWIDRDNIREKFQDKYGRAHYYEYTLPILKWHLKENYNLAYIVHTKNLNK